MTVFFGRICKVKILARGYRVKESNTIICKDFIDNRIQQKLIKVVNSNVKLFQRDTKKLLCWKKLLKIDFKSTQNIHCLVIFTDGTMMKKTYYFLA